MCNCASSTSVSSGSICNQCAQGNPCGCPPSYTITPLPVDCSCCPAGYTYMGPTLNFPDGFCQGTIASDIIPAGNCSDCPETMSSDCVILPAIPCLGLPAGTTVTQLANFLCSPAFVEVILANIGLSSTLGSGFCQLVQNCPPVSGGTTPIILSITVTFP